MDSSTVIESTGVELTVGMAALADPVRLRLVSILATGGRCVCDLQAEVAVAPNLLSYHLRVLREAGPGDRIPARPLDRLPPRR